MRTFRTPPKEQTKQLEDVQRRVLHVIFGNIPYDEARRTCNILSLAERRHELGKRFFRRVIKDKSNVLLYLLPAKRDVQLTTRLRRARQYPTIYARTNRYKNSLSYLDKTSCSDVISCMHDFLCVCLIQLFEAVNIQ